MKDFVEWFGYGASVVVAVSLLMSSLLRLRWINLTGALLFTAYGLMIHAYPVALLNFAIAGINVWHLVKLLGRKEDFKLVPAGADSPLLAEFLRVHEGGIRRFFPEFAPAAAGADGAAFFTLRDARVAGVILTRRLAADTLGLTLDYVIPEYRDFKVGRFVFGQNRAVFRALGVSRVASEPHSPTHREYLLKMGFAAGRVGDRDLLVRAV